MAKTETRKRYLERDYKTPKAVRKAAELGVEIEESEYVEIPVVEVEGPNGTVRLTEDVVKKHQAIWAEMEAARAVDDEGGKE